MIILVDMDEVVADFETAVADIASKYVHPIIKPIDLSRRKHLYLKNDFPEESRRVVERIYQVPGFYRTLPPMPGAVEALNEMLGEGYEVYVCTAPHLQNPTCESDKRYWMGETLGGDWLQRLIITRDKTLIIGDLLFDDRPRVSGALKPMWRQIIFDRPYNRDVSGPRLIGWENWRSVIAEFEPR
jgi:5'-nucleotidase